MRMLKYDLAADYQGHYTTPRNALTSGLQVWSCISCGSRLILHAESQLVPLIRTLST